MSLNSKTGNAINNIQKKTGLSKKQLLSILIVLIIIILIIIIIILVKKYYWNKENPIFFTNIKDSKKYVAIPSKLLYEPKSGYNFTFSFWVKVNNWNYKFGSKKHILTKGRNERYINKNTPVCPSIWLDGKINDILFYIETSLGIQKFRLKDIPIGNWNYIVFVCHTKTVALYINGLLSRTITLKAFPKTNYGNLHVNSFGGYDGNLASIMYCPRVMSLSEIYNNYKLGPNRMTIFTRIFNKIKKIIGINVNDNNLLSNLNEEKCGNPKLNKQDSEEVVETDEKLEQAKKDYEEALKRKKLLEKRSKQLKQDQERNRKKIIRDRFNKIDKDRNNNISFNEFEEYSYN